MPVGSGLGRLPQSVRGRRRRSISLRASYRGSVPESPWKLPNRPPAVGVGDRGAGRRRDVVGLGRAGGRTKTVISGPSPVSHIPGGRFSPLITSCFPPHNSCSHPFGALAASDVLGSIPATYFLRGTPLSCSTSTVPSLFTSCILVLFIHSFMRTALAAVQYP